MPEQRSFGYPTISGSQYDTPQALAPRHSEGDANADHVPRYGHVLPSVASLTNFAQPSTSRPSPESGSPLLARPLGVHQILNPSGDNIGPPAHKSQYSPRRVASAAIGPHPSPLLSPRIRKRGEVSSPGRPVPGEIEAGHGRRLLTPKSPGLRAFSQGSRNSPNLAQLAQFGNHEGRMYTAEPGEHRGGHVPPLPALAAQLAGETTPITARKRAITPRTSLGSSSASYSTGAHALSGSPRPGASPHMTGSLDRSTRSSQLPASTPENLGLSYAAQRHYSGTAPAYLMELNLGTGPITVDVDIDTQQASKLADEKRKRNAGASARFRQRRKEKEHASSQAIADLQRQMREISEERDYYMHERDFFREVYSRLPGSQVQPRPPSPRIRRLQGAANARSSAEMPPSLDYHRREASDHVSQRRRTGEYQPAFARPSTPSASSYAQQSYALPPPPPPPPSQSMGTSAPMLLTEHRPPQPLIAPPTSGLRPQTYDPFKRDASR